MFRRERTCLLASLTLATMLAFPLAPPASARPLHLPRTNPSRPSARELFAEGLIHRLLAWLGLAGDLPGGMVEKQGSQVDPNGGH